MNYENAGDVLPEQLLKGIPLEKEKKAWGEVSGYRHFLVKRNQLILNMFLHGIEIRKLSKEFFLSEETIKRIVYSKKPTSRSAMEYSEAGMLEEWIHTYLLFDRYNKAEMTEKTMHLQMDYYLRKDTTLVQS
ncbi:hypothetical protein [Paenibacillus albidus]|uniref:hypothetical protein n=1 Tax=Paenibacillus albidus TaxID=2041023 RepID=UPI002035EE89|nr:hypothetical protein [Paenibacillus albidus]